jgi:ATP-dependent DNA helicase RecG
VVLFEISPARNQPVSFLGKHSVRVGSSTTELNRHPGKARAIWAKGRDWSAERCESATLDDLDPEAIAKAREQFVIKHPGQAGEVAGWDDRTFLNKAKVLKQGAVTHAAR